MVSKVTMNERGAIVIPVLLREAVGLKPNEELVLEETAQGLLLRPLMDGPVELYTEERVAEFARDDEAVGKLLDKAE